MYSLVYKLYFYLKRKQKERNNENKTIQRILDRIEWFFNIVVVKWYTEHPSTKSGITKNKRKQKIIVSLTSYPKRIGTIWITIETLLRQSIKPDEIVLWLAKTQFEGKKSLPESLLKLEKRGLTIRFCDDLRSHKKYFYTMQEYPEDIVVLADDDMIYPYDMVKQLMKMHDEHPYDICTMTAQVMVKGKMPSEWRNPCLQEKYYSSEEIQIFSGSGSIYPPHVIPSAAFDEERIKSVCPYADDLWLTYMALHNGTKITMFHPWRAFPVTIYGTSEGSLYYVNAEAGQNDVQWQNLLKLDGD